jgi:hypothetical protein
MTEQEILDLYKAMELEFGELPNFEHYPRQFAYYYKLYKLVQQNVQKSN